MSNSPIEILEIRDLSYPILEVLPEGLDVISRPFEFDVVDRSYYQNGEGDGAIVYDAEGRQCTIVATRIYDLSPLKSTLERFQYLFLSEEWKNSVRAEVECQVHAKLSLSEVKAELMETLLANKDWWYDMTEHDIRSIFDGCDTFRKAFKSIARVGIDYKPKPQQRSKIFTDLTVRQKLK